MKWSFSYDAFVKLSLYSMIHLKHISLLWTTEPYKGTALYILKFRIFRVNFIFANSVKRYICCVKDSRLGYDLPTSVNDIVISSFCEDFIVTKIRIPQVSRK